MKFSVEKIKIISVLWLIIIIASCNKKTLNQSEELVVALSMAEENRPELEKVLEYYSSIKPDTLKYKAACFLIENMSGHYSYSETLWISEYYDEIDSIARRDDKWALYENVRAKYKDELLSTKSDLQCVNSEFLINNIEYSFNVWQNSKWAQHLDFEAFCEYLLPYKGTEFQTLDNWKEYFSNYANETLDSYKYCDLYNSSTYRACEAIMDEIRKNISINIRDTEGFPVNRMRTLQHIPFGSCADYSNLAIAIMRANGVPCVIDYTPQWPFRNLGHSWCTFLNNFGKHTIFDITDNKPGYPHKEDHKFAKIFRKTYAINKELREISENDSFVPSEFSNICIKDVTDEYISTINIELQIQNYKKAQHAYLAVFNNQGWTPVSWGKIVNGEIEFVKMGKNVVYLPVSYDIRGMYPISNPILVTNRGEIVPLTVNLYNKQDLTLRRKYPFIHDPSYNIKRIVGAKIQASDNINFEECETLYTISEASSMHEEVVINPNNHYYRYWRYLSSENSHANIAELAFIEKDSIYPIKGKIIGTEGSYFNNVNTTKETVFDNNPLTFFDAPFANDCWVGMDFGSKINISKIQYLARGDGNSIEIGNQYELFYWYNGWNSLGVKKAINTSLMYKDCPTNTIFLLRNITHGKEERIFTYENGEQIWW